MKASALSIRIEYGTMSRYALTVVVYLYFLVVFVVLLALAVVAGFCLDIDKRLHAI